MSLHNKKAMLDLVFWRKRKKGTGSSSLVELFLENNNGEVGH